MQPETYAHIQVLRTRRFDAEEARDPFPRAISAAVEALGSCDALRSKLTAERIQHLSTRNQLEAAEGRVEQLEQELETSHAAHELELVTLRRELDLERERLATIKAVLEPVVRLHEDLCSDGEEPAPETDPVPELICEEGLLWGDVATQPNQRSNY